MSRDRTMKSGLLAWLGLLMSCVPAIVAEDALGQLSASKTGEVTLHVQPVAEDGAKRVVVSAASNGSIAGVLGTADVIGFPFMQGAAVGDIDWRVDGSKVSGSITGKDGVVLGNFEGTITATGMSGKFTHVDGRVGLWSWNGPIPTPGSGVQ